MTPCPLPDEHEREILTIFIEECAEAIQRATKLLRFGRDEIQPDQPFNNAERLGHEVGDLEVMIERLKKLNLVTDLSVYEGRHSKEAQLKKFMQTRK